MVTVAIAFVSFALIHSITVSRAFKNYVSGIIGETRMRAYYRLGFTLVSVVTAVLAGYVIIMQPDTFLYRPPVYILWPARALQFAGIVMFLLAQKPFKTGYFTGLRQAGDYIRTGSTGGDMEGIPEGSLVTTGIYGLVRNPMYLAGIIIFLFEPVITANNLVLRTLAVAYFIWGGYIEERRFAPSFGDAYHEYRRKVPLFNIITGLIRKNRNWS
jgi:protein-S-isoprenylcysteine O-methyltransferase Ste14